MQKPSWCLVVKTMYSWPAVRARSMKRSGSNLTGIEGAGERAVIGLGDAPWSWAHDRPRGFDAGHGNKGPSG